MKTETQEIFPEVLWEVYKSSEKNLVSKPEGLMTPLDVLRYFQSGYDFYSTRTDNYSSQTTFSQLKKEEFEEEVQTWKKACIELSTNQNSTTAFQILDQKIETYQKQANHAKDDMNDLSKLPFLIENMYTNAFLRARKVIEQNGLLGNIKCVDAIIN